MRGVVGIVACVMALVLGSCELAQAQVVRWTDERGEVHIGEGMDSVPERYRGSAEVLSRSQPSPPAGTTANPKAGEIASVARGVAAIRFRPGDPIMALVRINGSAIVTLMIDTGADLTLIHSSVMKALGVDLREAPTISLYGVGGARRARVVMLDKLEVGDASVRPFRVTVMETGMRGQGLIGRDFLSHFLMSMDSVEGTLTLVAR